MLTKIIETGMISILNDGQIQVREDTVVNENGIEISRTYIRYVLPPTGILDSIIDPKLKAIAEIVWTPEIVKTYEDKVANLPKFPGL